MGRQIVIDFSSAPDLKEIGFRIWIFGEDLYRACREDDWASEAFVKKRLESVFPLVLPPRRLLGPRRAPLFSLFFAMANRSKTAQQRARPIAAHILRSR
jgi:hypothetical protein